MLQPMLGDQKPFYSFEIKNGQRYDIGNKFDYLKTMFDFALRRDDIGEEQAVFAKTLRLVLTSRYQRSIAG